MEMCRATDFGFSVIALLIKSREAPILRRSGGNILEDPPCSANVRK